MIESVKLTELAKMGGCSCKLSPAVLQEVIAFTKTQAKDEKLLVGNQQADDAAVYDLGNGQALISTTDFFLPVVDDAYNFGAIAATNALSDVYAMGGKPIFALAILGWPIEQLGATSAQQVMKGAADQCAAAGIPIAGGHSIESREPFFGLVANGLIAIKNIKQNNGAKEGDALILTKPLGLGILSTAVKRNLIQPNELEIMLAYQKQLNTIGSLLGERNEVNAITDITGFGLAGHLIELCNASQLSAEINYAAIPKIQEALPYLKDRIVPDATFKNWSSYGSAVSFESGVNVLEAFSLLPDPQTSGGLLISVKASAADEIIQLAQQEGFTQATMIGKLIAKEEKTIKVL